jgi:hypothetical protein
MKIKKPDEYCIDDLEGLRADIQNATNRLNGDKTLDIPATDTLKDDDWNAFDTLNWRFASIVGVINTDYKNPVLKEAKSQLIVVYQDLIDSTKKNKPYLTEKFESVLKPKLYDVAHLKKLRNYLVQARHKVEGDNSLDSPNSHYLKNDATTPIERLNIFLDSIVNVLHTPYSGSDQKIEQLNIYKEYIRLISVSQLYPKEKFLTERLEKGLKETNSIYSNYATIEHKLV